MAIVPPLVDQLLLKYSKHAASPSSSYHPLITFPSPDLFSGHAWSVQGFSLSPAPIPHGTAVCVPFPVAQKVPFGFPPNICPATVLGGRTFLLPFFQFSLRW